VGPKGSEEVAQKRPLRGHREAYQESVVEASSDGEVLQLEIVMLLLLLLDPQDLGSTFKAGPAARPC